MDPLLKLLCENARLSNAELAVMSGKSEQEVEKELDAYRKSGVIRGYKVLLDYEKLDTDMVMAFIEVGVTPKYSQGFDDIAKLIMRYEEVDSVYLTSGSYDLSVHVRGRTFREVCLFVANRLAPLESVVSTRTNFVLSKYKEGGVITCDEEIDERSGGLT